MKIAYVYYEDIRAKKAHTAHTLSTCSQLGNKAEVDYFHAFLRNKTVKGVLSYFKLRQNFRVVKIFCFPLNQITLIEHLGRLIFFFQVARKISKGKYDFILTSDFSFLYFFYLFPFLKPQIPIFYEAHKVYSIVSKKIQSHKIEKNAINRNCTKVFSITNRGKKDLEKLGVKIKIVCLPNGVDLTVFKNELSKKEAQKRLGLDGNKFIVLYSGSFLNWKGVDVFVKSAKYIQSDNVLLLAVGAKPDKKIAFEKLVDGDLNVKIIERQDRNKIIEYMAAADICVLPTLSLPHCEGEFYTSPIKLFEYMAIGLPIIASDLPSLREVLNDENALFFEQGDSKDLAKKIELLKDNKLLQEKISQNNLNKVKDFSLEKRAGIIINEFKTLC